LKLWELWKSLSLTSGECPLKLLMQKTIGGNGCLRYKVCPYECASERGGCVFLSIRIDARMSYCGDRQKVALRLYVMAGSG
jgi:hypothetical protein